jgi:glycosyltransferase involved in cell wall biosynthesis
MRILVLTKRQYMGKDLLDDRFGRFWELPLELARRGHEIRGISLSYRKRSEGSFMPSLGTGTGNIKWHSVNLLNAPWLGPRRYFRLARQIIGDFRPAVIWACSDAYHAILAHRLAKDSSTKLVVDLYDNFESYPATKLPGVLPLFKRAVKAADGVTCVSSQLVNYVAERYRSRAPALLLENAIRTDLFRPMERAACRRQLGLPSAAKIIGTAGALYASRGIDALYRGFAILAAENPNLHLALAGPRRSASAIPRGERIHDFGALPLDQVAVLFNALDVAVVCNRDSSFGRYNFPQKAREIIACGTALVAAEVGAMKAILRDQRQCLFAPDDAVSLAAAIRTQLAQPTSLDHKVPAWSDLAVQLETFFLNTSRNRA